MASNALYLLLVSLAVPSPIAGCCKNNLYPRRNVVRVCIMYACSTVLDDGATVNTNLEAKEFNHDFNECVRHMNGKHYPVYVGLDPA